MKIQNFFFNLANLAASPGLSNAPVINVDKADMKEIQSYLDKENVPYNVVNEQEMNFKYREINFMVIENDKSEDTGLDQRVVEPAKWQADLSEEDQQVVEANTFNGEAADPLTQPAPEEFPEREEAAEKFLSGETAESVAEEKEQQQASAPAAKTPTKVNTKATVPAAKKGSSK